MQKKYTKNIHLYSVNNKLNKNIFELDDQELSSISIPNNISIHKYFYTKNIQDVKSNLFIFNSSIINNELANFIVSFSDQLNIWIFLDNEMSEYNSKLKYISNKELDTDATYKILPNNIINKELYRDIQPKHKLDQIIYFIENNDKQSLNKIEKYLYPNSKLPIKLFDSDKFEHPQNLGYLTEPARRTLLVESKYYMHSSSNFYLTESSVCGCIPINIDSDHNINDQLKNNIVHQPKSIIYYTDFLKELYDAE